MLGRDLAGSWGRRQPFKMGPRYCPVEALISVIEGGVRKIFSVRQLGFLDLWAGLGHSSVPAYGAILAAFSPRGCFVTDAVSRQDLVDLASNIGVLRVHGTSRHGTGHLCSATEPKSNHSQRLSGCGTSTRPVENSTDQHGCKLPLPLSPVAIRSNFLPCIASITPRLGGAKQAVQSAWGLGLADLARQAFAGTKPMRPPPFARRT